MAKQLPAVVLVGRPNVGKSTLFNRIAGNRRAIVSPVAGTTRDLIQQESSWRNRSFLLADTAGMFGQSEDPLQVLVVEHGRRAFEAADIFVFVVDGREGLVPADLEIAVELRLTGRPVLVAINKTDDKRARAGALDFYELGFEPVMEISAEHGQGIGDLLDEVIQRLPERAKAEEAEAPAREPGIAIIGRPNVGKSSLVNRILREERVLVSDVAGTTRDSVDATFQWHRRQLRIVDTAGIRRPGKVSRAGQVEGISVLLARRAIATADIVVLLIDATQGSADQDGAIAGEAERAGRSIILAVNKWDLVRAEGEDFAEKFDDRLRFQLKFLEFAPIIHISALTGERTPKLLELIDKVLQERTYRVPTPELNRFIKEVTAAHPPPSPGRGAVRIMYAAQVGVSPPTFALFTNIATEFHFSYERFLVNQIRKKFGFSGTPIRLQIRRRERKSLTKSSEQGRPPKQAPKQVAKQAPKFVPKGAKKAPGGPHSPQSTKRVSRQEAPGGGKSGRRRRKAAGLRRP